MRAKQMSYRTKLMDAAAEENVGTVRALVSVFDNVDFQGDRVVKGAFADTLVDWRGRGDPIPFIWSHQWSNPDAHVGWIPPDQAQETDDGLEVVASMDLTDPPAAKVYQLLKDRRVTQFSFAFDVEEEVETDEETDRGWYGVVYELRKLTLYEAGPCLLGANQETELLEVAARNLRFGKQVSGASRDHLLAAAEHIHAALGDPDESGRGSGVRKTAIAPHGTATSDGEWDGPANEANLNNEAGASTYRRAYAWVDPDGDPDAKASYRFIHHFVSSDGTVGAAATRACSTGIGVLNGARGGTTIPEGDRQGVYNHLARHLRDADLEVPELASVAAAVDPPTVALEEMEKLAAA